MLRRSNIGKWTFIEQYSGGRSVIGFEAPSLGRKRAIADFRDWSKRSGYAAQFERLDKAPGTIS